MRQFFRYWFGSRSTRRVYFDFAAATPVVPVAIAAMQSMVHVANPEGIHTDALRAHESLEKSRATIANLMGTPAKNWVFTSGATEANNLAIQGVVRAARARRGNTNTHLVVSAIEHASVLEIARFLEKNGEAEVTYVSPDKHGRISASEIERALTPNTVLVSVGWANSEVGSVQSVHAIAAVIRKYEEQAHTRIVFHSDAGQAPLYLPSTIPSLGVDMLTLDSGKLYGPRGIGALYVRDRSLLEPVFFGGGQEWGLRPGTVPVTLAAGFAAAFVEMAAIRKEEKKRIEQLRQIFTETCLSGIPQSVLNGDREHILPHVVNISIPDVDVEYLALMLDARGFAISTKSSCEEGERESHVVRAMFPKEERWRAQHTLRFSFGLETARDEVRRGADALIAAVRDCQDLQK